MSQNVFYLHQSVLIRIADLLKWNATYDLHLELLHECTCDCFHALEVTPCEGVTQPPRLISSRGEMLISAATPRFDP